MQQTPLLRVLPVPLIRVAPARAPRKERAHERALGADLGPKPLLRWRHRGVLHQPRNRSRRPSERRPFEWQAFEDLGVTCDAAVGLCGRSTHPRSAQLLAQAGVAACPACTFQTPVRPGRRRGKISTAAAAMPVRLDVRRQRRRLRESERDVRGRGRPAAAEGVGMAPGSCSG